jgi:endoglucanase
MRVCQLVVVSLGLLGSLASVGGANPASASGDPARSGISVSGNRLVDGDGNAIRVIGVNRSGAEYACMRGWGIFDGPTDAASTQVIRSWHANAVRLGLNEDCWLGINGVPPAYGGLNYQHAVIAYVNDLTANGMYVILDLHWSAPGVVQATSLRAMPDADHSSAFWQSVATAFIDNHNVLFDVFNEPFGVGWDCWRDGCAYPGGVDTVPWQTVGTQSLVNTIRATGATQPILLGGLAFANDLSGWRSHEPDDPLGQLVASFHVYPFNPCNDQSCWDDRVVPLAAAVPVIVGEVGSDWTPPYSDAMALELLEWSDTHYLSYLGWTWNTWGGGGDALLTTYAGEVTSWGADFRAHIAGVAVPRARLLVEANRLYSQQGLEPALDLYEQVLNTPPSEEESPTAYAAIDGLARFREVVGLTAAGREDEARQRLTSLIERDPDGSLARLATQFWDQYGMTVSARAACAQLAPQVATQAGPVLIILRSVGVDVLHDQLCVLPFGVS